MQLSGDEGSDLLSAARRQRRVLIALMLRNIRTRFGGHGLGYLLAIGWPIVHMVVLLVVFSVTGRVAPYGDSLLLFVGTGTIPFMAFSYMSRFMIFSAITTRPLLGFPEVKISDVLLASALLEVLTACLVAIIMVALAWSMRVDFIPKDVLQAVLAFGTAVLLGLGFGYINGVLALAIPFWMIVYVLALIILWASSGVVFVPDVLPETVRSILSYNPILQVIEWMRSAYYEGYGYMILDRPYPVVVGLVALFLGLLLERAMRGYLLSRR
jgi:capsular polysaccharide transport system permease protein